MVGFTREFQEALKISEEAVDAVVDRWMDIEYFHKYIAVDRALEANDGPLHFFAPGPVGSEYTGIGWNHNYYWYAALDIAILWPVPWDLDLTLGAGITDAWIQDEWNDLEAPCLLKANILPFFPPSIPPACDELVRSLARRGAAYRKVVVAMLEGPFSDRVVLGKIARWEELLAPYVVEEVEAGIRRGRGNLARWQGEVQRLRDHLATRRDRDRSQHRLLKIRNKLCPIDISRSNRLLFFFFWCFPLAARGKEAHPRVSGTARRTRPHIFLTIPLCVHIQSS